MATRTELSAYLRALMPEIQWVQPYLDNEPLPPPNTNWATLNIMNVSDRGWSQSRQTEYDPETGLTTQAYDVQRIYAVQFDFYGPDALNNATVFKQNLQVGLATQTGIADLKSMSEIRNLTFLMENKAYMHRYNFDTEMFVVDTITKTTPAIETAEITIVNRGNNI